MRAVLAVPDLAKPGGVRNRAVLETLYSTGMRRQELLGLSIGDLDRERGVILIRHGKGMKDRVVPVGVKTIDWIDRYLDAWRRRYPAHPTSGTLFLSQKGLPMSAARLAEIVHACIDKADIGKRGACHLLRHSMATAMLEHGADIRYIQAILGHAQLTTTQIYAQVSIRQLKAVHTATHSDW